jgi:hypothetical protein
MSIGSGENAMTRLNLTFNAQCQIPKQKKAQLDGTRETSGKARADAVHLP